MSNSMRTILDHFRSLAQGLTRRLRDLRRGRLTIATTHAQVGDIRVRDALMSFGPKDNRQTGDGQAGAEPSFQIALFLSIKRVHRQEE